MRNIILVRMILNCPINDNENEKKAIDCVFKCIELFQWIVMCTKPNFRKKKKKKVACIVHSLKEVDCKVKRK